MKLRRKRNLRQNYQNSMKLDDAEEALERNNPGKGTIVEF
jgi:hypothetical protein